MADDLKAVGSVPAAMQSGGDVSIQLHPIGGGQYYETGPPLVLQNTEGSGDVNAVAFASPGGDASFKSPGHSSSDGLNEPALPQHHKPARSISNVSRTPSRCGNEGHNRSAEEGTAAPEGRQNLLNSLWEGQWNATLASLVACVIFIVLLVVVIKLIWDPVQPFLERGARADLASENPGWQLCPQLIDYIEKGQGAVATFADLLSGTTMSCTTPSEGREISQTWPLGPHLLNRLATTALLRCTEVPAFCYDLQDMNKAAFSGDTITDDWIRMQNATDPQYCREAVTAMSKSYLESFTGLQFAELHDMLFFNEVLVVRILDKSGIGRMDYVFDGTVQQYQPLDPEWLLQCALDPVLKSSDVGGTLQNLSHDPFSADVRNCLSSPLSRVKVKTIRQENWPPFSGCFQGVISQDWKDFQTAFEVAKLKYRSRYLLVTYDNLLACYTGLLGGVIAGLVLLCGNVIYQIILWSCRRRQVFPCYGCLACSKFSEYPLLSQDLAQDRVNVPSGRYRTAV